MEFLPYPHVISTLFNGCEFGPPQPFTAASSCTWIDHPVSGLCYVTFALFTLGFPSAPDLRPLTSPHNITRRTVLQKVRDHSHMELSQFAGTGFQVLFHSPPGVLFTFPSRYYALSVTKEYLALRGGPRVFRQGSTCLVLLWILTRFGQFRLRGFHPLWQVFPGPFCYRPPSIFQSEPRVQAPGLGSSAFARRYLRNHGCFLFLRLLRCFSSPGSLHRPMYSACGDRSLSCRVAPFRYLRLSVYLPLPAAFRSLSRLSSALSAKASALRPT